MTTTDPTRADAAGAAAGLERLLDDLADVLADQLEFARRGNYLAVLAAQQRVSTLLDRVGGFAHLPSEAGAEKVRRIHRLRRELILTLAAARQDAADGLARLRNGRRTLRAYRRG